MENIKTIIEMFGGLVEMSRKTDIPVSTIQSWRDNGKIPYWRHDYLKNMAKLAGLNIDQYLA